MKRRELITSSAALGLAALTPSTLLADASGATGEAITPPAKGSIPVAFLIADGAVIIDFCGPWEVFQDTVVPGRGDSPFRLYTVAETTRPIRASGGMKIVPDYDLASAPEPKVLVIPAQQRASAAVKDWVRNVSKSADVSMSVCTGAFLLASTGLLSGKSATTHHGSYVTFAMSFPDVRLRRGARFVEEGHLASAGGLSSGIDLALRIVERYFGREVATRTAFEMEYQGKGWLDASSNQLYSKPPPVRAGLALCPVCWMEADPASASKSVYGGRTYYFCMEDHKKVFDASPTRFLEAL
jgi:putative intracellular protease/amidase